MAKKLKTVVAGPFAVNCYLYWDDMNGDGIIIDPGAEAGEIFEEVTRAEFQPKAILLTHGHGDHIAAVDEVKKKYDIPLYLGDGEQELLENPGANVSAFFDTPIVAPPPDHLLRDEQPLTVGSISLRVLSTPGHSPAGVAYLDESQGILFCGDSLFAGSIGRTDLPGSSHDLLIESIQKKIMSLPDSIVCYPGHGPRTTVGAERVSNPFLVGGHFA